FAVVQHHFDAVRVCGTFREDAGHDALRQCAGALVLLLHDLHAQTRANFTAYWHTHSFSVSPEETPGNSHTARSAGTPLKTSSGGSGQTTFRRDFNKSRMARGRLCRPASSSGASPWAFAACLSAPANSIARTISSSP